MHGEYHVSGTFNVTNLSHFDVGDDLRTNHFKEEGNDGGMDREWSVDPLEIPLGLRHEPELRDSKKPLMF